MTTEHRAAIIAANRRRKGIYKHSSAARRRQSIARYKLLVAGSLPGQQLRNLDKAAALGLLDPFDEPTRDGKWREPAWQCRRCRQPRVQSTWYCAEHLELMNSHDVRWLGLKHARHIRAFHPQPS